MRRFWLALVGLASVSAAAQVPAENILTLDESIRRALQNNQRLLSAKEDIRIAEHRVQEARSFSLPKAGLNFNSSRYLAEKDFSLPPEFGSVLLPPSRGLEADTYHTARAWLRQPVYNGGRSRHTSRLAEANLQRARIQYEEVRAQVVLNVTKAFLDVLLRRREIRAAEEAAENVSRLADEVPANDLVRRAELHSLRTGLRRQLAEKRRLEEKAMLNYLDSLGLELYTNVDLEGELATSPVELDLARLLAWAQESRLELRRTEYQKEIDRLAVNLSQAERYPIVDLGAGYELTSPEFPLETAQWNATLNVSLPLFDGFSSRARIRQRRAQANQSRIQRAEIEDRINLEVRETYGDLSFWQQELAARENDLRRAETIVARADDGRSPVAQARAREALWEAQLAYWEAVHAHRLAKARLERAVGRSLTE